MASEILFLTIVVIVVSTSFANTQLPSNEVGKCTKGSDCGDDHCCVFDPIMGNGVCQPMKRTSEECHTSQPYAWVRPVDMVTDFDSCPCERGDFCVPLDGGELGICSYG